jgi:hypothetical protein
MSNIVWVTGFNAKYYQLVFRKVMDTWQLLPGDQIFYADGIIDELGSDPRTRFFPIDPDTCPDFLTSNEAKFWRKSRSIVQALRENSKSYDYCIWLDADVRVLRCSDIEHILPRHEDIFSVNHKVVKNPATHDQRLLDPYLVDLGIDTGFLAFNLHHPRLPELVDLYEDFWHTDIMAAMIRKYDTYALMHLVEQHDFPYRNLWRGTHTAGKHYCGFEDSALQDMFYHYWGQRNKGTLNDLA